MERTRPLADSVGPNLRILFCGLNPSPSSAENQVAYARPGNRFWPAALAAGIVTIDRDPAHALEHHGVGFTDLVARVTSKASELEPAEYVEGLAVLDALVVEHQPAVVCFVGLSGWRAAVNRKATAGWQPETVGGRRVYVMPSTSGLNAHAQLPDLTEHLRTAFAGPKHPQS